VDDISLLVFDRSTYACIDTGANASAEEAEEGVEDTDQKVNNVVNSFRLVQTSFDKKSYLVHLKGMSHFLLTTIIHADLR